MNSVQERLRYLRETILDLSLREFRVAINEHLGEEESLSLGTLSNYERSPGDGARRAGPRVEFLTALKGAFPEVRLDWVMFGDGEPTEMAELLASAEGLEGRGEAASPFASRVLERYPDIEVLPPEGAALFMAALTRLAMGEPDRALDESLLLELAGDLRWLLLLPVGLWGFRHDPSYETFSDYTVAFLHALMLLIPPPARGDAVSEYAGSRAPALREAHPVGL